MQTLPRSHFTHALPQHWWLGYRVVGSWIHRQAVAGLPLVYTRSLPITVLIPTPAVTGGRSGTCVTRCLGGLIDG